MKKFFSLTLAAALAAGTAAQAAAPHRAPRRAADDDPLPAVTDFVKVPFTTSPANNTQVADLSKFTITFDHYHGVFLDEDNAALPDVNWQGPELRKDGVFVKHLARPTYEETTPSRIDDQWGEIWNQLNQEVSPALTEQGVYTITYPKGLISVTDYNSDMGDDYCDDFTVTYYIGVEPTPGTGDDGGDGGDDSGDNPGTGGDKPGTGDNTGSSDIVSAPFTICDGITATVTPGVGSNLDALQDVYMVFDGWNSVDYNPAMLPLLTYPDGHTENLAHIADPDDLDKWGYNSIVIKVPAGLTASGEYIITVPANCVAVHAGNIQASVDEDLPEFALSFFVNAADAPDVPGLPVVVDGTSIATDPASGTRVEYLEEIALQFQGWDTAEVKYNVGRPTIAIDDQAPVEVKNLSDDNSDYSILHQSFATTYQEKGKYVISYPANYIKLTTDAGESKMLPAFQLEYYVKIDPADYNVPDQVVLPEGDGYVAALPADGSEVESLESVFFRFNACASAYQNEAVRPTLTKDGGEPQTLKCPKDDVTYDFAFHQNFDSKLTEPGTYVITYPACEWELTMEDGSKQSSPAFTLTYTIPGGVTPPTPDPRPVADTLTVTVPDMACDGRATVEVVLNAPADRQYCTAQWDIDVPEGFKASEVALNAADAADHQLIVNAVSDRLLRCILYSSSNAALRASQTPLFTFKLAAQNAPVGQTQGAISGIIFNCAPTSDADAQIEYKLADAPFSINITDTVKPVAAIALSETSASLKPAQTLQLTAAVTPDDATNPAVVWSSDNIEVATVSAAGVVTAVAPGSAVITATAADGSGISASCSVRVRGQIAGDADDDGLLTISDIVAIAKKSVGIDTPDMVQANMEMNGDGIINCTDVTLAVAALQAQADIAPRGTMLACGLTLGALARQNGALILPVALDGAESFCGIQFDVTLPQGLTLDTEATTAEAGDVQTLSVAPVCDGTYRIVMYGIENFRSSELVELALRASSVMTERYELPVSNVMLSDYDCGLYQAPASVLNADASGVNALFADGIEAVDVYNTQGVLVARAADAAALRALPAGLYVARGIRFAVTK